jgi:hypothetical protein
MFLDPFGQSEATNAALWQYLGYGVSFAEWENTGYSGSLLERLHANIISRKRAAPKYPHEYAERLAGKWARRLS